MSNYSFVCSNPEIQASAKPIYIIDEVPNEIRVLIKQTTLDKIREDRNKLLETTDKYITMSDMPNMTVERIEELKIYRQQLRDYMNNLNIDEITGLNDVIPPFPAKPSYIK